MASGIWVVRLATVDLDDLEQGVAEGLAVGQLREQGAVHPGSVPEPPGEQ
jgi:hypothetical protein